MSAAQRLHILDAHRAQAVTPARFPPPAAIPHRPVSVPAAGAAAATGAVPASCPQPPRPRRRPVARLPARPGDRAGFAAFRARCPVPRRGRCAGSPAALTCSSSSALRCRCLFISESRLAACSPSCPSASPSGGPASCPNSCSRPPTRRSTFCRDCSRCRMRDCCTSDC